MGSWIGGGEGSDGRRREYSNLDAVGMTFRCQKLKDRKRGTGTLLGVKRRALSSALRFG